MLPQRLSGAPGLKAPLTGRGSARWSVTVLPSISQMRLVNVSRLFLQHVDGEHCQLSGYLFWLTAVTRLATLKWNASSHAHMYFSPGSSLLFILQKFWREAASQASESRQQGLQP